MFEFDGTETQQLDKEREANEVREAADDARIEDAVYHRMLDESYVIDAVLTCVQDSVHSRRRVAELLMRHGDDTNNIANLRIDVMDCLRDWAKEDLRRGRL